MFVFESKGNLHIHIVRKWESGDITAVTLTAFTKLHRRIGYPFEPITGFHPFFTSLKMDPSLTLCFTQHTKDLDKFDYTALFEVIIL